MRLNRFLALHSGLSRRKADQAISEQQVTINGRLASLGQSVNPEDIIKLNDRLIKADVTIQTIMLNKPVGYVCSRAGQGNRTIYDLLPAEFQNLQPVGRLDKESSGLLLLTNDGKLANQLTHPYYEKEKIYEVKLNKKLTKADFDRLTQQGVRLDDGLSKFSKVLRVSDLEFQVSLKEGRNRQIRRTFTALDYQVAHLHRIGFGQYSLGNLKPAQIRITC